MRAETHQFYMTVIERVLRFVQDNLDAELSCSTLSKVACVSQYHFFRMFEVYTGETIGDHVRRIRLEKAAFLLRNTSRSVIEVAFMTGFSSHQAFCRAFRTSYGAAPRMFRMLDDGSFLLSAPSRVHIDEFGGLSRFKPQLQGGVTMEMSIKTLPELTVVYMMHTGAYNTVGQTWEKFNKWVGSHNELVTEDSMFICEYLDDPSVVPENKLRSLACMTVPAGYVPDHGVTMKTIPGCKYAVGRYVGPYTKLGEAWHTFYAEGLPSLGCKAKQSPCFELYINGPHEVPPEQLITDIYEAIE